MVKRLVAAYLCFLALFTCLLANAEENTGLIPLGTDNFSVYFSLKPTVQHQTTEDGCLFTGGLLALTLREDALPDAAFDTLTIQMSQEKQTAWEEALDARFAAPAYTAEFSFQGSRDAVTLPLKEPAVLNPRDFETDEDYQAAVLAMEEEIRQALEKALSALPDPATVQGNLIVPKETADSVNSADYKAAKKRIKQADTAKKLTAVRITLSRLASIDYADSKSDLEKLDQQIDQQTKLEAKAGKALKKAKELMKTDSPDAWQKASKQLAPYKDLPSVKKAYLRTWIGLCTDMSPFYQDVAAYCIQEGATAKWGLIRGDGTLLTKPVYDHLGYAYRYYFAQGELGDDQWLIRFKKNGLYGYLNTSGKVVIKAKYKEANPFRSEYTTVKNTKGRWQVIDAKGKVLKTLPKYTLFGPVSEGYIYYEITKKNITAIGFVDTNGNVRLRFSQNAAIWGTETIFRNNRLIIGTKNGYFQLISKKGKTFIKGADGIEPLSDGNYAVTFHNKKGYYREVYNKNGKKVNLSKKLKAAGLTAKAVSHIGDMGNGATYFRTFLKKKSVYRYAIVNKKNQALTWKKSKYLDLMTDPHLKKLRYSPLTKGSRIAMELKNHEGYQLYKLHGTAFELLTKTRYLDMRISQSATYFAAKTQGGIWTILDSNGKNALK